MIATSDNGYSRTAGVEALEKQGRFPGVQFRGYKSGIWDGGHCLPFIVRWPGKLKVGTTSDALICLGDLMATCAEIGDSLIPISP